MALRELIPWNRKRDVRVRRRGETEPMVYIVKWIPKDQDVIIDHSTRYSDPSRAIEFAVSALQLNPKRIWIEDCKGLKHSDHETIVSHRGFVTDQPPVTVPASNEQDEATRVFMAGSEAEVPVEQPSPRESAE